MNIKKYKIYLHRNLINNKVYIGQTVKTLDQRSGLRGQNYVINRSYALRMKNPFALDILKYGWENFSHEILATTTSQAKANLLEIKYIKKFNACNSEFGYNKTTGGTSNYKKQSKIKV